MDKSAVSWEKQQELRAEYQQELAIDRKREMRNRVDNQNELERLQHDLVFYRMVTEVLTDLEKLWGKHMPSRLQEVSRDQERAKSLLVTMYDWMFNPPADQDRDRVMQEGKRLRDDLENRYGRASYDPKLTAKNLAKNKARFREHGTKYPPWWGILDGSPYAKQTNERFETAQKKETPQAPQPPRQSPTLPASNSRIETLDNLERRVSNWAEARQAIDAVRKAILSGDKPAEDDLKRVRNALYRYGMRPQADMFRTARIAMQFDTKEALDKYLKEHPGADRALHSVKSIKEAISRLFRKHEVKPEMAKDIEAAPAEVHDILTSADKRKESLAKISQGIQKSGKAVAKRIQESAHKELHEIKHAIKAAKKLLRKPPEPISKEDRGALYAAGAYVAGAAIATIPPGGALMAAGALGKAFALHVGIKAVHDLLDRGFVHFEWGEHIIHGIQHLAAEQDAEQALFEHLTAHVTHQLSLVDDKSIENILKSPEKAMKTATAETFRLSGAVTPNATLMVKQTDLDKYQITLKKPGEKEAKVVKEGLPQREAEQVVAVLAAMHQARIKWIGHPLSTGGFSMNTQSMWRTAAVLPNRLAYIPARARDSVVSIDNQGTDIEGYTYKDTNGRTVVILWEGRAVKPTSHYWMQSDEKAQKYIQERIAERKATLARKVQNRAERSLMRQNHDYKVGDILVSSWGYDQTNVDFYQVTSVNGQKIIIQEIRSKIAHPSQGYDLMMPVPNAWYGAPMNRMVGTHGIKVNSVQYAYKWDGKPQYQTAAGYGH